MGEQNSENFLYYGDNLDILPRYIDDESVDLIYLDPPFKSNQDYNVLFTERDGSRSAAQILAFEDTWHWDQVAARAHLEVVEKGPEQVSKVMEAFKTFLGENDMLAYLSMMAPRLIELWRVLKPTGSIYLHCDPTASHYLKLLMDAVFKPQNFRNEIVWKRSQPKAHVSIRFSRAHDVLLFYAKSEKAKFHLQYREHDPEYLAKFYKYVEPETQRRYRLGDLTNPNKNRPNLTYEFPPDSGVTRVWRWTKERMMRAWEDGRVIIPEDGGVARGKRFLDEMEGAPVTDLWDDIEHLHGSHQEALGYPTQKPEALLERVIQASSREGDIVLDPFCGCGTAIAVAQQLHRRWIGIDITHLAINLIKHRLKDAFGDKVECHVIGEPTDLAGAAVLAVQDPYQFQWWALGLVGARPTDPQKGSDRGIDGRFVFHDANEKGKLETRQIIFSVKSGNVSVPHVRDLRGVIEREKAAIGVLLSLHPATQPMKTEAASAGFYNSPLYDKKFAKIQILTIEGLLKGKVVAYPPSPSITFKKAPKAKKKGYQKLPLLKPEL